MLQLHEGQNDVSSEKEHDLEKLESKAIKLALKWDYFDGVLPILEARQEKVSEIDKKTRKTENEIRKIENEIIKKEDEYMTTRRMNEKKEDLRQVKS
jgi:Mg2+ and Co2+ transporter CorA